MQNYNCLANGKELTDEELERLQEMNKHNSHVLYGGKNKVAFLTANEVLGQTHIFMSMIEFAHYTSDLPTIAGMNAGRAWTRWAGKNKKLNGVGSFPDEEICPHGFFNTYIKPNIIPVEGDCTHYLTHLRDIICDKDQRAYEYIVQYFAHIVQKPQEKPNVAIVMKSVEGAGKGTMMKPLLQLFGAQGIHINGDRYITGQFNSAVTNKLLIFADEVDLTSTATADKLKAFISESTVQMEKKGLEAVSIPNYARVIFASNREHVISAGTRERRYLVLEPNAVKAQDTDYFRALYKWIDDGGAPKLLHYLSHIDLTGFNPFQPPSTSALIDQKLQSLNDAQQYIYEQLIDSKGFAKTARVEASKVINDYHSWCENRDIRVKLSAARSQLGKLMTMIAGPSLGRSDRATGKYYELPDIKVMRENFAGILNLSAQDIFN